MDWPPPEDPPQERWHRVVRLDALRSDRPRLVRVGVKQLALFAVGGSVYATSNVCPHAGGSLAHGQLRGCQVTCPRHEWTFDVTSGACPEHPIYQLTTYRVEVRHGDVFVALPDETW